jgi:hypothetical protein
MYRISQMLVFLDVVKKMQCELNIVNATQCCIVRVKIKLERWSG